MNLRLLLISLLLAIKASAQTDTTFYNQYGEKLPSRDSAEYYKCSIVKSANGEYKLRKYHSNGNLESVLAEDIVSEAAYIALNIIENMPVWEPARDEDGFAIKSRRTVDIEFKPIK